MEQDWTIVRIKVMNERAKWQRIVDKRMNSMSADYVVRNNKDKYNTYSWQPRVLPLIISSGRV